jgi:hypothetical protein
MSNSAAALQNQTRSDMGVITQVSNRKTTDLFIALERTHRCYGLLPVTSTQILNTVARHNIYIYTREMPYEDNRFSKPTHM